MTFFVQEYVIRFDVAVDDAYFMQALNGEELDGAQEHQRSGDMQTPWGYTHQLS
jgi:hypothetical protein